MLNRNFVKTIEKSIRNNWSLPALSDYQGETFSYSEIAEKIIKIHMVLSDAGIKKGDKIVLLGKNSANWGIIYMSVVSYGTIIVPILPDFPPDDIHHLVEHSEAKAMFIAEDIYATLEKDKLNSLRAVFSLRNFGILQASDPEISKLVESMQEKYLEKYGKNLKPNQLEFPEISNEEISTINYTSGTAGFSKGVILPYNSLMANLDYAQNNMPLKPGDSIVSFLPMAHTYGLAFEFVFPFSLGCHITFLNKTPSPQIILKAFKEIRPQLILSVPLVIEKIYKKQITPVIKKPLIKVLLALPGLKKLIHKKIRASLTEAFGGNFHEVVIGGAALNKEVELFLKKIKFRFATGYGMTECGPLISYAGWKTHRQGSAGKLVDCMEIKIDSKDPYKEVGEILLKGENLMTGYYKNKEATKAAIDEEGWLHTGDQGLIDKDDYIYIKGRSKSMILGASGQNIYPEEIEAKVNNMPYVNESVVVDRDGRIIALVFPEKDLITKEKLSAEDVENIMKNNRDEINATLPYYMNISKIELQEKEFEKTPKKSIKRYLYK